MKNLFSRLLLVGAALLPLTGTANNLRITNPGVVATAPATIALTGTVTWDNSWNDVENWDGVWLFAKYRDRATPNAGWRTATLSRNEFDHQITGLAFNIASDGKGVVVYRSTPDAGTSTGTVRLGWDAAADGIAFSAMSSYDVRLFGIEMVYIPEGPFNLNATDSPGLTNEFTSQQGSLTAITSEAPLPVGAIRWINDSGAGGAGNEVTVAAATYPGSAALGPNYPKGFAASYCMKYEVSQGQYTDFLNSLTRTQQTRRVPVDITGDAPAAGKIFVMAEVDNAAGAFRNTITCPANGMGTTQPVTFTCTRPDRAANFLVWADGAAYLDWAGLRPQSELEFEKACRGPLPVVANELAGGTAAVTAAATISGPEDGTETISTPNASYTFDFVNFTGGDGGPGPLRSGIFATAASTRAQAGAGYYGVLDMSGNCWERTVTVAELDGGLPTNAGSFSADDNGDGLLDANGNHDAPTWPNATDVRGSNFRGGNWSRPALWAAVSDRQYGGQAIAGRTSHRGIRGARSQSTFTSAPTEVPGTGVLLGKYFGGSFDGYGPANPLVLTLTGLREDALQTAASAAPNPAHAIVTLHLAEATAALTNGSLTITDALGRPVRTLTGLTGAAVRIERAGLAAGVYFYRLTDGTRGPVAAGRVVWQ